MQVNFQNRKDIEIISQLNMFALNRISKSLRLHLLCLLQCLPNTKIPNHSILAREYKFQMDLRFSEPSHTLIFLFCSSAQNANPNPDHHFMQHSCLLSVMVSDFPYTIIIVKRIHNIIAISIENQGRKLLSLTLFIMCCVSFGKSVTLKI